MAYRRVSGKKIVLLIGGIGIYTLVITPLLYSILQNEAKPLQYRFGFTVHEAILYLNDIGEYGRNVSLIFCAADSCCDTCIALSFTFILSMFLPAVLKQYELYPRYEVCNIIPLMLIILSDIENIGYTILCLNFPLSVSFHSGWVAIVNQVQWIFIVLILISTVTIIGIAELIPKKVMKNNLG